MSEEYDIESPSPSVFWPLLVLVAGLLIWAGYQVYATNAQRSALSQQFQAALPTIKAVEGVHGRYIALMKDLVETSQKDPAAAQIVKEAISAGWIRMQPKDTNDTTNPAAPAATK